MHLLVSNELPLALLLEVASNLGGSLLVVTGVFAGALRSWAVLTELPPVRTEWMTARVRGRRYVYDTCCRRRSDLEIAMVRGLVIRISCILFGVFPVGSLLHLNDASSEFAGLMVILYAVATANYLAYYCVKHQDEIPTRPERP